MLGKTSSTEVALSMLDAANLAPPSRQQPASGIVFRPEHRMELSRLDPVTKTGEATLLPFITFYMVQIYQRGHDVMQ